MVYVIESMVLMKGRSKSNLYVLRVGGGSLMMFESPTGVTFVDDGRFGLEGKIVVPSTITHSVEGEFDHLISHTMAYTLEESSVCALGSDYIRFGSFI